MTAKEWFVANITQERINRERLRAKDIMKLMVTAGYSVVNSTLSRYLTESNLKSFTVVAWIQQHWTQEKINTEGLTFPRMVAYIQTHVDPTAEKSSVRDSLHKLGLKSCKGVVAYMMTLPPEILDDIIKLSDAIERHLGRTVTLDSLRSQRSIARKKLKESSS